MGRPRLQLVQVNFRLTQGQYLDLMDNADKLGMTVPAYAKMLTILDIKREKVDKKETIAKLAAELREPEKTA